MVTSRTSAAVLLAMIPAALFTLAWPAKPKVPKAPPSYLEQVHPFAERFGDETPVIRRVRTVSILPVPVTLPAVEAPVPASQAPSPPPARARIIRRASLDVCQRHGMRKVNYGRRWRCRR